MKHYLSFLQSKGLTDEFNAYYLAKTKEKKRYNNQKYYHRKKQRVDL